MCSYSTNGKILIVFPYVNYYCLVYFLIDIKYTLKRLESIEITGQTVWTCLQIIYHNNDLSIYWLILSKTFYRPLILVFHKWTDQKHIYNEQLYVSPYYLWLQFVRWLLPVGRKDCANESRPMYEWSMNMMCRFSLLTFVHFTSKTAFWRRTLLVHCTYLKILFQ